MKNRLVNWPTLLACVAISAGIGWLIHHFSGLTFWASWGMVALAWVGVGISTFFDDEPVKKSAASETEGRH
jgi:hypothetical protein